MTRRVEAGQAAQADEPFQEGDGVDAVRLGRLGGCHGFGAVVIGREHRLAWRATRTSAGFQKR